MPTVDDSFRTNTRMIVRSYATIRIYPTTQQDGEPEASRTYASEHAALCAFGRAQNDPNFVEGLVANYKIRDLRPEAAKLRPKHRGVLKMDFVASVAIDMLVTKKKDRATIEKEVLDEVERRHLASEGFPSMGNLRMAMSERGRALEKADKEA